MKPAFILFLSLSLSTISPLSQAADLHDIIGAGLGLFVLDSIVHDVRQDHGYYNYSYHEHSTYRPPHHSHHYYRPHHVHTRYCEHHHSYSYDDYDNDYYDIDIHYER